MYDVIVIGAGFAGVTAARDLSQSGHSVLLLEARDRIGGRTWTKWDEGLGKKVEYGGQFVHWTQPMLWREIRRHGMKIAPGTTAEYAKWIVNGQVREDSSHHVGQLLEKAMTELTSDSREVFPDPYAINAELHSLKIADDQCLQDRVALIELDEDSRALLESIEVEPVQGAFTQTLRRTAMYFGDWSAVGKAGQWFRLSGGMTSLIEAMEAEGNHDLKLSTPVRSISQSDNCVHVESRTGEIYSAKRVLITTPVNTLRDIQLNFELPNEVKEIIEVGTVESVFKVWARLRGGHVPFSLYAPPGENLFYAARVDGEIDGDTLLVGFGRGQAPDGTNTKSIEKAINQFIPGVEVVAATVQDWASEEFSKGAWVIPRPGQMSHGLDAIKRVEGLVTFAGSDIADGFQGWVEGAIDSATLAAQKISIDLTRSTNA